MPAFRFSRRTSWDRTQNAFTQLVSELKGAIDLTESNPTRVGLGTDPARIAELGHPRGATYSPDPLGHRDAREAIAGYYRARGLAVDPDRIVVAASTSEAYGWLFKLLTERGDRILVPKPSYPLFDYLADLEDVRLDGFPLVRDEDWRVDTGEVERSLDERTRAVMLVHPNNPTGTFVRRDDAEALVRLASARDVAVIADEVFGDYAWDSLRSELLPSFVELALDDGLSFVLSGLSKVALLPQVKLAWIVVGGRDDLAIEALRRLEIVADTYLSTSTPVQLATPALLAGSRDVQRACLDRVRTNLAALDAALAPRAPAGVRRCPAHGGWYAVLEVPATRTDDAWVEHLARDAGVIVQPGWFFDMPRDGFLVVSLIVEPDRFAPAVRALADSLTR